ncbi:uncharacterized protein LOC108025130 [Drosophila biarmipes]|uniref:uncharacterized protein LOC108025130 n=1 Tax=Drosophila biarmipes TaxID=125945 RepID=UPI0007E70F4E|nr:uncharacterized protein LOC108025130 [Drosophila biarmipes]
MDMFCKFLSADLYCLLKQIFNHLSSGPSPSDFDEELLIERVQCEVDIAVELVTRPSYTIRHKYPGPLVTYDGEARCEPRLIRFSDLNSSQLGLIFEAYEEVDDINEKQVKNCPEEEDPCEEKPRSRVTFKEEPKCSNKKRNFGCQASYTLEDECSEEDSEDSNDQREGFNTTLVYFLKGLFPQKKCSNKSRLAGGKEKPDFDENPASDKELEKLEDSAKAIYDDYITSTCKSASWNSLKPAAKLRFQWKALTGDDLKETPYENFSASFTRSFREAFPSAKAASLRNEKRLAWCHMDRSQRMPFILQALLYQVAMGAIDPDDHCAVRELFHKLR